MKSGRLIRGLKAHWMTSKLCCVNYSIQLIVLIIFHIEFMFHSILPLCFLSLSAFVTLYIHMCVSIWAHTHARMYSYMMKLERGVLPSGTQRILFDVNLLCRAFSTVRPREVGDICCHYQCQKPMVLPKHSPHTVTFTAGWHAGPCEHICMGFLVGEKEGNGSTEKKIQNWIIIASSWPLKIGQAFRPCFLPDIWVPAGIPPPHPITTTTFPSLFLPPCPFLENAAH